MGRKCLWQTKRACAAAHHLILEDCRRLSVSGVNDIDSFDENTVLLHTENGVLEIRGEGLHIGLLDVETGELTMDGTVRAMIYQEEEKHKKNQSFWARLFR